MGHKNKESLYIQACKKFEKMFSPGQSKHADKKTGCTQSKIYSYSTLASYKKHAGYFLKFCKEKYKCKTIDDCRPYIKEWIATRAGLSAYTVKLEAAALGKLYQISTSNKAIFGTTAPRIRINIKRSRGTAARDKHFSEKNNADIVVFCKATGLRRCELERLTGDCLIQTNGALYVNVKHGKGGKSRLVPVFENGERVAAIMTSAGTGRVFSHVPSCMDVHSYRREYATSVYRHFARPYDACKQATFYNPERNKTESAVYYFRKDRLGQWLDKRAMLIASKALGHNRISVVGEHYIDL